MTLAVCERVDKFLHFLELVRRWSHDRMVDHFRNLVVYGHLTDKYGNVKMLFEYIAWLYRIFRPYPTMCDIDYDIWNEWKLLFVKDATGRLIDWSMLKPDMDYVLTIERGSQIAYLPIFREEITKMTNNIYQIVRDVIRDRIQNLIYDFDLNEQMLETEYGSLYGQDMQHFIPYYNDLGVITRLNSMKSIAWQ